MTDSHQRLIDTLRLDSDGHDRIEPWVGPVRAAPCEGEPMRRINLDIFASDNELDRPVGNIDSERSADPGIELDASGPRGARAHPLCEGLRIRPLVEHRSRGSGKDSLDDDLAGFVRVQGLSLCSRRAASASARIAQNSR